MKNKIQKLRDEFNKKLDKLEAKLVKNKWQKIGNLEWSEDLGEMNWCDATKKCKEMGGRLPTRLELMDLYDNHRDECRDFVASYYWSSTEYNTNYAWSQHFGGGYQDNDYKDYSYYVRCVRSW